MAKLPAIKDAQQISWLYLIRQISGKELRGAIFLEEMRSDVGSAKSLGSLT